MWSYLTYINGKTGEKYKMHGGIINASKRLVRTETPEGRETIWMTYTECPI